MPNNKHQNLPLSGLDSTDDARPAVDSVQQPTKAPEPVMPEVMAPLERPTIRPRPAANIIGRQRREPEAANQDGVSSIDQPSVESLPKKNQDSSPLFEVA